MFDRTPYCVLVGDQLYMMYVVGSIVCFDTARSSFSVIALPGDMPERTKLWFDYKVGEHRSGSIALVHFCNGDLVT
jgi:hypothetical protein